MLRSTLRFASAIILLCVTTLTQAATVAYIKSDPFNGSSFSRTDAMTVTYSGAVPPNSISSTDVKLQSATGIQPVLVSVSGAVVSIRPKTPLLPWTNYTLTAPSVLSTDGAQAGSPLIINFKTQDGEWQPPQLLYSLAAGQWNVVTRSNAKGVRFILWLQTNASGGDDIWAVRQLPGKPAEAPALVKSYPYGIYDLNVFIDDDGNAMASWVVQRTGPPYAELLRVSRFLAGTGSWAGWGTPQNLDDVYSEAGENSGSGLHIVFDHAGNALAVWGRYQCCGYHELQTIVASRYTRVNGWTGPTVLDDSGNSIVGGDNDIELRMDDAGNGYAVWSVGGLPYTQPPMIAHYTLNTGWNTPQPAGPYQPNNQAWQHALAVNHQGEAMIIWPDFDGLNYVRGDSSGNLSTPHLVADEFQPALNIVLPDNGRAIAVFADGVRQFVPSQNSWTSKHPLFAGQTSGVSDAQIVADATGNAFVAWTQASKGINRIFAKRYLYNYGWQAPIAVDTNDTLGAGLEELRLDTSGSATVSWWQNNASGTADVMAAHYQ
ncbi:MAG TPA: Ig-like domain-containing protein [Steroidobacteraceae bacterium]|nr:Ig-like domain-containing protein [Steroidobacteraceae bacterium]